MTVTAETNKKAYAGDGTTASFSTAFTFSSNAQVTVTLVASDGTETEWTEGSEYTLTGAGTGAAGTVTVDTSPTDYTPASGETLVIQLKPDYLQSTPLPRGGTVSPKLVLEPMYDTLLRQILRLKDDVDRSVKAPISETTPGAALPLAASRAGKVFAFDANGYPTVSTEDLSDIEGAATSATEAAASAVAAAASASAASDDADDAAASAAEALAAVGAVKVSSNDTTPGDLETKLLVGDAFTLSTQNDGGNETRTIDAAFASQAEAEAGTATDKPLNALRVSQAIASLSPSIGKTVQRVYGSYATYSSHTTVMPADDTIPQNTEGEQILSVAAAAASSATNRWRVTVTLGQIARGGSYQPVFALFRDSDADAVYAGAFNGTFDQQSTAFTFEVVTGDTNAATFKLRIGPASAGTIYVNGTSGGRALGGVGAFTMVVEEIEP